MKRWGIDEWVNRNKRLSCQRERCLHNIWKFRSRPLGESWAGKTSQEMKGRARRKGQSGCTPAERSWKIRRICGSHRMQGGNWSCWISGILLRLLRRHHCRHRCLHASFSQLVSKVISYLFMNYATRALPHQRQTLCTKYTSEETFHPPPRKSDVILG